MKQQVVFPSGTVNYYSGTSLQELPEYNAPHTVLVTDATIAALYPQIFEGRKTLVIPAGEDSKHIETITALSDRLLEMEADRGTLLIGVGGGVITDITGFIASVYMRGIRFGFIPTTLLAMVDASIGGKNGVNLGLHKNVIGTIRQPEFILYDTHFLSTLPTAEWSNGFAEIIKYACIFDADMFHELQGNDLPFYRTDTGALDSIINRCVAWKNKTVTKDEQEKGIRKLLNFGHTAGHAIETLYSLPHGHSVSIGMVVACLLSETYTGLEQGAAKSIRELLQRYGLPHHIQLDPAETMNILKADKKRKGGNINYILLKSIGDAVIHPLPLAAIEKALQTYESNN